MQPTLEALLHLLRLKKTELEFVNVQIEKRLDAFTDPENVRILQKVMADNANEIELLKSEIGFLERDEEISTL
jgi:hypothetical protein